MSILVELKKANAFHFGSIPLKMKRISAYAVCYPNSQSKEFEQYVLERILLLNDLPEPVHIVGIANSGIPLSNLVYKGLKACKQQVEISAINPKLVNPWDNIDFTRGNIVLVDNAVTTGDTLSSLLSQEVMSYISPTKVIRFFDREEMINSEETLAKRLKLKLNIELVSLFSIRDLLFDLEKFERSPIIEELYNWGTKDIKKYVEENYVFTNETWEFFDNTK